MASTKCRWMVERSEWLLSDHANVARSLVVGDISGVVDREVIDWDRLGRTLSDEDVSEYDGLVGGTA